MNKITRKEASLAVARLVPSIMRGVQLEFFVKRGVTQTQFLVLVAIRSYGRCGMGQLARSLHVSRPTISGRVSRASLEAEIVAGRIVVAENWSFKFAANN